MIDILDTLTIENSEGGADSVTLPLFYKEPIFFKKEYLHPELPIHYIGDEGNLIPYSIKHDDMIMSVLIILLVTALVAISNSVSLIKRQIKYLRFMPNGLTTETLDSMYEQLQQRVVGLCNVVAIGMLISILLLDLGKVYLHSERYLVLLCGMTLSIVCCTLKKILCSIANNTFFESKFIKQWDSYLMFENTAEVVLFMPILFCTVMYDINTQTASILVICAIIFVKSCTIYKMNSTFFRKKGSFLQNILYFCALEVIPIIYAIGLSVITRELLMQ